MRTITSQRSRHQQNLLHTASNSAQSNIIDNIQKVLLNSTSPSQQHSSLVDSAEFSSSFLPFHSFFSLNKSVDLHIVQWIANRTITSPPNWPNWVTHHLISPELRRIIVSFKCFPVPYILQWGDVTQDAGPQYKHGDKKSFQCMTSVLVTYVSNSQIQANNLW